MGSGVRVSPPSMLLDAMCEGHKRASRPPGMPGMLLETGFVTPGTSCARNVQVFQAEVQGSTFRPGRPSFNMMRQGDVQFPI